LLILPGVAVLGVLWVWVRRAMLRERGQALGHYLGGRPPRNDDLEERQLCNVVDEMAIAAGIASPRTLIIDGAIANAAALGASEQTAVVLVGRALLDRLDRSATLAVVGHLIGSIANGDLRLSSRIMALFGTFGLLITLLDAPFSAAARAELHRLFGRTGMGATAVLSERTTLISDLLPESFSRPRMAEIEREPGDSHGARAGGAGLLDRLVRFVLLPLMVTNLYARMVIVLMSSFILGPAVAWTLRARRLIADATAVELTRDPDSLARAVRQLTADPAGTDAGIQALFIVPLAADAARGSAVPALTRDPLGEAAIGTLRFHPSLEDRLHGLLAQGAVGPTRSTLSPGRLPSTLRVLRAMLWRTLLAVLFLGPIGLVLGLSFLGFAIEMAFVGDVLVP
jgi:Zn-dependent protease with chaperone function